MRSSEALRGFQGLAGLEAEDTGESVLAIIESRAREIGLAVLQKRSMDFSLFQFSDTASYSSALAHCLAAEPETVLVSRTARGTHLVMLLDKALGKLTYLDRRHFDEAQGQVLLEEACVAGVQKTDLSDKFVAAAAFTALWRFVEASMDVRLQVPAVKVTFKVASETMVIDSSSARLLELVRGREGKALLSLFACHTAGGQHLLRQSLLQPSVELQEIQARQAAVAVLLQDETLFFQLQQLLPAVGDWDTLLGRLTSEPRSTAEWCKVAVRTALRLQSVLAALPALASILRPAPEGLLADARKLLANRRFAELHKELERVLDVACSSRRASSSLAHLSVVYAVKSNASALLDVARQTWGDSMKAIHNIHCTLAVKYPEMSLRLEFAEKKGWYLSHARAAVLPAEFLQTNAKGARLASTTRELNSENFKLQQAEAEILKRTVEVLSGLLQELRSEASLMHRASQATALLDLVTAFAAYALEANCVRPEVRDCSALAVKAGRHPLLDRLGDFEPIDIFMDGKCHFQTITGGNGGGKTTYLATTAQLVVLAHIGSFVPAKYAAFPLVTSLFTRMGTSDSLEASASSFLLEMQEASHILKNLSPGSLVLVDELGRGTAHADGLAICRAVCERLIELKVYTLFATHFFEICWVFAPVKGFRSMHLEQLVDGRRFSVQHVNSMKALQEKAEQNYGLNAAAQLGLPQALLDRAREMATKARICLGRRNEHSQQLGGQEQGCTVRQLLLLARSSLSSKALQEVLRELQASAH